MKSRGSGPRAGRACQRRRGGGGWGELPHHFGVVGAEHADPAVAGEVGQLAQATLVMQAGVAVVLEDVLVDPKARRAPADGGIELAVPEGGVAAVEQPALRRVDGD